MIHRLLTTQLHEAGLTEFAPPSDIQAWQKLLGVISQYYEGYDNEHNTQEEALGRSEEQFRLIFDHAPIGMAITSLDGQYIRVNTAYEELVGYTSNELYDTTYAQVTHPDDLQANMQFDQQLVDGLLTSYEMEKRCIRKNGSIIYVILKVTLMRDKQGKPTHFIAQVLDITAHKQAQAVLEGSKQTYQNLFAAAERRAQELTLLGQVRTALAQELDLSRLIPIIVEAIGKTFGYTLVSLYLRHDNKLVLQHQIGYNHVINEFEITEGVSGRVLHSGIAVLVKDVSSDPDFLGAIEGIVSQICVPLFDHQLAVGILNVESIQGQILTEADLELMKALGEHISIAIERARLYTTVREAKERYQVVVNNVREVIFQTDLSDQLNFLNAPWMTITDFTIEESLGQNLLNFIRPDERKTHIEQRNRLFNHQTEHSIYQTHFLTKQGSSHPVEVHTQLVIDENGNPLGTTGTLTDMNERFLLEKQAVDLQLQEKTVTMLKQVLSNIAHDLRTPLSIINTSTYLIRRKTDETSEIVRHLDVLDVQTAHLTSIVEDLMDISRLDDEVIVFRFIPVNLNGLIQDVLTGLQSAFELKRHTLRFFPDSPLPPVSADQAMLGKAIKNLIQNAISFTPENGSITVRTALADKNHILFRVIDNGIGIEAEDLPHIFERFYKVDKARPIELGGTGLGLTIAEKIITAHHGTIEVDSHPNKGSTFTVQLLVTQANAKN